MAALLPEQPASAVLGLRLKSEGLLCRSIIYVVGKAVLLAPNTILLVSYGTARRILEQPDLVKDNLD
jgi:hypothetical protein